MCSETETPINVIYPLRYIKQYRGNGVWLYYFNLRSRILVDLSYGQWVNEREI